MRLPADIVDTVDRLIADGTTRSRAVYFADLARADLWRRREECDAAIYAAAEPDKDLMALARWSAEQDRSYLDKD